ncbi:MAG: hypothetical protein AB7Y74_00740 [Syntrophorhabdus sp.]
MQKRLRKLLHPEAVKQFEKYIEQLISDVSFSCSPYPIYKEGEHIEDEWDCSFGYSVSILDKIANLLPSAGYLDRDILPLVFSEVLQSMFDKHNVIPERISEFSDWNDLYLKDFVDSTFRADVKQTLCEYFYNLPFKYDVLIPLPHVDLPKTTSYRISEELELIKINIDLMSTDSPLIWKKIRDGEILESIAGEDDRRGQRLSKHRVYLLVRTEGTSFCHSIKYVFQNAIEQLRILVGALFALDILNQSEILRIFDSPYNLWGNCLITPAFDNSEFPRAQSQALWKNLPVTEWDFICDLILNHSLMGPSPLERELIERGKKRYTPEQQAKRLELLLKPVKKVFNTDCSIEHMGEVRRVRNALNWYFNGLIEERESFSFILFTVSIETLLGDPNQEKDITERLADRCSYLLGSNAPERKEIKKKFAEAYNIRSRIVHQGKVTLDEKDKVHYSNIKWLSQKVLAKEINALPELHV